MVTSKKRYRLYLDESGDHTYRDLQEDAKRYLGLTGVVFENDYYRTVFHPIFEEFKQRHFPHNPDEPVILHRRDLIDRKGPFWRLRDAANRQRFNEEFLKILMDHDYILITVVLDKKNHIENYGPAAFHPYHYCLTAILERYCGWLNYWNAEGDVLAESRGGGEDAPLEEVYRYIYQNGTRFRHTDYFQNALTSREIKIKKKEENITGLQIADLLAHPCKQEVLIRKGRLSATNDFGQQVRDCIQVKWNRRYDTGEVEGYGMVFL